MGSSFVQIPKTLLGIVRATFLCKSMEEETSCFLAVSNRAVLVARLAVLSHFFPQQRGGVFPVTRAVAPLVLSSPPQMMRKSSILLGGRRFGQPLSKQGTMPRKRAVHMRVSIAQGYWARRGVLAIFARVLRASVLRCLVRSDVGRPTLPGSGAACANPTSTGRFWVTPSRCRVRHKFPTALVVRKRAWSRISRRVAGIASAGPCFANGSGVFGCGGDSPPHPSHSALGLP